MHVKRKNKVVKVHTRQIRLQKTLKDFFHHLFIELEEMTHIKSILKEKLSMLHFILVLIKRTKQNLYFNSYKKDQREHTIVHSGMKLAQSK